jgi:hypothetical protein
MREPKDSSDERENERFGFGELPKLVRQLVH